MSRTEKAIEDLIATTLGPDADQGTAKAYREALTEITKLAVMESELDRLRSMIQVRRALSDSYNEEGN